ncbi:hypothetical protein B0H19DRAFT_1067666 [Mycena capillaripes]|nr:hypothetical protein B0H19DRAFT_1067666 [Mycena capillaripes]
MFHTLSPANLERRSLQCPPTDNTGATLGFAVTTSLPSNDIGCGYGEDGVCLYTGSDGTLDFGPSACPLRLDGLPTASGNLPITPTSGASPTETETNIDATAQPRKATLPAGSIAGITCGIVAFLLILSISMFLVLRKNRQLKPIFHAELADSRTVVEVAGEKLAAQVMRRRGNGIAEESVPEAEQRQQAIAERIVAVQSELAALTATAESNTLRRHIEILQDRNRELESQLRSQWALGLSNEPPPGYLA